MLSARSVRRRARELRKEQIEALLKEYEGWGLHFEDPRRRYMIFDPQNDLDKKKPLDKTRWILAWGA